MLRFSFFSFFILSLVAIHHANSQSYQRVLTSGYSKKFISFSFIDGILDQAREIEAEENLTFATFDEVTILFNSLTMF